MSNAPDFTPRDVPVLVCLGREGKGPIATAAMRLAVFYVPRGPSSSTALLSHWLGRDGEFVHCEMSR